MLAVGFNPRNGIGKLDRKMGRVATLLGAERVAHEMQPLWVIAAKPLEASLRDALRFVRPTVD